MANILGANRRRAGCPRVTSHGVGVPDSLPPITRKLADTLQRVLDDRVTTEEVKAVLIEYNAMIDVLERDEANKRVYEPGNYG